jgi:lactoylglutathione lyase
MTPVQSLFETHLTVTDLDRAVEFYRDVVGLQLAYVTSSRAAFFWIGSAGNAMLGLWAGSGPQKMTLHTAFRASLADVIAAPSVLRAAGVTPLDFNGQPTDDPDGHLLEYIAMLPHTPSPEEAIVRWRVWELTHSAAPPLGSSQTPR